MRIGWPLLWPQCRVSLPCTDQYSDSDLMPGSFIAPFCAAMTDIPEWYTNCSLWGWPRPSETCPIHLTCTLTLFGIPVHSDSERVTLVLQKDCEALPHITCRSGNPIIWMEHRWKHGVNRTPLGLSLECFGYCYQSCGYTKHLNTLVSFA